VRDGLSDADVGAGSDGSLEGTGIRVRTVWAGIKEARDLRGQLPARETAGGTERAVHPAVPSRLGSAQRSAARSGAAVPRHRSTDGGAHHRSEAARAAR